MALFKTNVNNLENTHNRGEWGPLNLLFYFQPVGYNFQRISRFLCAVLLASIAEQNVENIILYTIRRNGSGSLVPTRGVQWTRHGDR